VNTLPDDFDASVLPEVLADGWGFDVAAADYAPLGAGSYHWVVRDRAGTRGFVTVDDLDHKAWLGDEREVVFDGLRRVFGTALALSDGGLDFVVAPIAARDGGTVRRVAPRYAAALFPFVDGESSEWGRHEAPEERAILVSLLAKLHRATPAVTSVARTVGLDLPGRQHLEAGLRELNVPWSGGAFSEPAREALARHAADVTELIGLADRLAAAVAGRGNPWVITHGEPHSGNFMRRGTTRLLVDWDTVALAPPERDLWMVVESAEDAAIYANATGRQVDEEALSFFRLTWDLKDLAEYLSALRSPHRESEDTQRAYNGIVNCVTGAGAHETPRATQ
jgi:spectinomycin phosphotransferase